MAEANQNHGLMSKIRAYLFPWGAGEPTVDEMVEFALAAEELGYEAIHVPWHFTMPKTRSFKEFGTRYLLDPMVLMPMLAAKTTRIKLAFEFVVPTLHPFVWAQYFASLDQASNGRALAVPVLGWWDEDFGVGMVKRSERGKRMDEALATIVKLWRGEPIEEEGRFWDCRGLELNPRPVQQPFPLWIGGGEKSLDRAARFGSAFYPLFPTAQETRDVLVPNNVKRAAEYGRELELAVVNYGLVTDDADWLRDYAYPRLVARTNGMTLDEAVAQVDDPSLNQPSGRLMIGPKADCAARLRELVDAGTDHLVLDFYMHGWESPAFGMEQMRKFATEVVPLCEAG